MTQFGTQTDVLRQAASHVEAVNTQLQTTLRSLQGLVNETAGYWQGEAQRAFLALMERYGSDAARLNGALRGIGEAMHQSGATYQATEEGTTAAVRSAGSGLTL